MSNYLDSTGLLYFWQKIKSTFSLIGHTHTASDVTDFNDASGVINKGVVNISGQLNSVGTWIKNNRVNNHYICCSVKPTASGYFGNSGFSVLAMLSSANYGWCILQSDNAKMLLIGRLSGGTWYWAAPSLTTVTG